MSVLEERAWYGSACTSFDRDPAYGEFTAEQSIERSFLLFNPRFSAYYLLNIPVSLSYSLAITYVFQCDVYRCNCCDLFEEDLLRLKHCK